MKIAIYGETKDVEEFLRSYNGEVSFCIDDIEKGRNLEKEGLGQFSTCYLRMAGSISKEDIYICLKDIPLEHAISIFKMGLYVIFANDFYYPAPITSYDYSYRFELEELFKIIEDNNASFFILPAKRKVFHEISNIEDTNININKSTCKKLSKGILKLFRRSVESAKILSLLDENPHDIVKLILNDNNNDINIDEVVDIISQPWCQHDTHASIFYSDIENTAAIIKEIIKYFQKK